MSQCLLLRLLFHGRVKRTAKLVFVGFAGNFPKLCRTAPAFLISNFHRAMNTDILVLGFYTVCRLN